MSALRQWGGTMIDCGTEVAIPREHRRRPPPESRRGPKAVIYTLADGSEVTTRKLHADPRNKHGLTPDAFRSRLRRGEDDPQRLFWSESQYRQWKKSRG